MRRVVGVLLLLLGGAALAGGAAVAVLLGPDGRAITGPHPVGTDAKALLTGAGVISWAGPTVTVDVTVPDAKPVFVGVANIVDVEDYLRDTDRLVLDELRIPWQVETERVAGRPYVPAAPTAVDWWIASGSGQGGAITSFQLPEESASVAVIALGETDLSGMTITGSYDVRGGFGISLGVAAVGIGVALFGWVALRTEPYAEWDEEDWEDEATLVRGMSS
jgi:nucleotide-binding universal stress UspA family protein